MAEQSVADPAVAAADVEPTSVFLRACRGLPVERTPVWLLRQAGQKVPERKPILELNPKHPLVKRLAGTGGEAPNDAQLADWAAVKEAHGILAERGLLKGTADHGVTRSLYTADPDGNEIELYCDTPREEWEGRVAEAMTVRPLALD